MRLRCAGRWLGLVATLALGLGCGARESAESVATPSFQSATIEVGALGDPAVLQAVDTQRGEWQETKKAKVVIEKSPLEPKELHDADLLLFPGDRLGELVDAGALAVLPNPPAPRKKTREHATEEGPDSSSAERSSSERSRGASNATALSEFLPAFRDDVSKYGDERVALPYGASALVLVYRREAFEEDATQKAAKEAGLKLAPPETWSEFDKLARFLHGRDWNGDGNADYGVAFALGSDRSGLGEAIYLARAASAGLYRDQYSFLFDAESMEPRIATPPFVDALTRLVALKDYGPPDVQKFDGDAARKAFRTGNVAFLIDRAELAAEWTDHKAPGKVGVAALPGSERVFDPTRQAWETSDPPNRPSYLPHGGGWLVGVAPSANAKSKEAAIDFAGYLTSRETSSRILADQSFPMLSPRGAEGGQVLVNARTAPGVDSRLWSKAVAATLGAPRVVPGLRIPGTAEYLSELGSARAAALAGEPAERVLKAAAEAWSARTKQLGKERQLWHYRRSLNRLVTAPKPPAR